MQRERRTYIHTLIRHQYRQADRVSDIQTVQGRQTGQTGRQTGKHTDKQTVQLTDTQTEIQTYSEANGQTTIQTE